MFFADRWPGFDDAIVRPLEMIAHEDKGLRELLADVSKTFTTPEIRIGRTRPSRQGPLI